MNFNSLPLIIICISILAGILVLYGAVKKTTYIKYAKRNKRIDKKAAGLSPIAEQILLAGSEGPIPEITVKEIVGGALYINTYGKKFATLDPKEKSENAAAIEELLNNELIKHKRKDVYSLTPKGIKTALAVNE